MNYKSFSCRNIFLAILFFFIAGSIHAQEFTPPDSIGVFPDQHHNLLSPNLISPNKFNYKMYDDLLMPDINYRPVTYKFKINRYLEFPTEKSLLHKGEYNVSGAMKYLPNGVIHGYGKQINLIGLGVLNEAGIGYTHNFNNKLLMEVNLHAKKLSVPRFGHDTFGASGNMNYKLSDKIRFDAFGSYYIAPSSGYKTYDYGGKLDFDISERFGTEVGVRRHYDSSFKKWETLPILTPYYKFDKFDLGMDVGGFLLYFLKDRRKSNPIHYSR